MAEQADRLARFEAALSCLQSDLAAIEAEQQQLKQEGKIKTYRYKELTGAKMTAQALLARFRAQGLLDDE